MADLTPDQLLLTVADLRGWTGDDIEDDDALALNILAAVSIKLWQYGDKDWTRQTLPREAKLIGDIKAKNFWQHPDGAKSEQIDVLSSSYVNEVLLQLVFTDAEIDELQRLGGGDGSVPAGVGVWSLTVTRGPLETHGGGYRGATHYQDSWDSPFPLLADGYFLGPQ